MDKIKLILFSALSMIGVLIAWGVYYIADIIAKYSTAFDQAADFYHGKVTSSAK